MTKNRSAGALCLMLAAGQVGCDGEGPVSPTAPSSQTQQTVSAPVLPAGRAALSAVSLFGVVTEATPSGNAPVAGVTVYCDACGVNGHTWLTTAADGSYRFSGDLASGGGIWLLGNQTVIWVVKEGYQDPPGSSAVPGFNGPGWRAVPIDGDTRFDVRLVKE
jgi:hypothetical protein